jgi:hypothetical protein
MQPQYYLCFKRTNLVTNNYLETKLRSN